MKTPDDVAAMVQLRACGWGISGLFCAYGVFEQSAMEGFRASLQMEFRGSNVVCKNGVLQDGVSRNVIGRYIPQATVALVRISAERSEYSSKAQIARTN